MIAVHAFIFLFSIASVWFFGGMLVEAVARIAKRLRQSGFTVAFFVLGFMTSVSEISVMASSSLNRLPQISAGNLSGASLVILLFVIPFLAVAAGGIELRRMLGKGQLAVALCAIFLPTLFLVDGTVTRTDGLICLAAYAALAYSIRRSRRRAAPEAPDLGDKKPARSKKAMLLDFLRIAVAGVVIFAAGYLLVEEAAFFARLLQIPSSIIGLLVLSLGTNVPELVIAARSVGKGRSDIAFGDYLGSAAANTAIFGILSLINGSFAVAAEEFEVAALVMAVGFILFYKFARSKASLSKKEGIVLLCLYAIFVAAQALLLVRMIAR